MVMLPELFTDKDGTQRWFLDGKYHREDGPAFISAGGNQLWYIDGQLHREDGPAIISADGEQFWYVNYKHYSTNKEYQDAAGLSDQDMTAIILTYGNVT